MRSVIDNERILKNARLNNEVLMELTANNLKDKISSLINVLEFAYKNIENKDYRSINGLGIIQQQGQSIDVLCAKLSELERMYRELNEIL